MRKQHIYGNGFKSILSRLQQVKASKSIDDLGEDISDVEAVLRKFDIKLRDSVGEFREMESVIDEVANRWKEFTSVEQAQIATAMAGEHAPEHIEIYGAIYKVA